MNLPKSQIQFVLGEVYDARIVKREPDWRLIAEATNKKFGRKKPLTGDDARDVDAHYVNLRSGLAEKPLTV